MAIASFESDDEVRNTKGYFMLSSVVRPPTMKSTTSFGWNWLITASIVGENGPMTTVGWLSNSLRKAGRASTESAASSTYDDLQLVPEDTAVVVHLVDADRDAVGPPLGQQRLRAGEGEHPPHDERRQRR